MFPLSVWIYESYDKFLHCALCSFDQHKAEPEPKTTASETNSQAWAYKIHIVNFLILECLVNFLGIMTFSSILKQDTNPMVCILSMPGIWSFKVSSHIIL